MSRVGVIVPAYHGASTLSRSLESLAAQRYAERVDVVVAVNDGRADTLAEAQRLGRRLEGPQRTCTVIRTARGRSAAINEAESLLGPGPRFYVDQDALLAPDALEGVAARLAPGRRVHFATPRMELAASSSALSRGYYRVWRELPYVVLSPVTVGVYAVSARGRERWARLPAVQSDDKFVRLHFAPDERVVVGSTWYEVLVPCGARELVRARRGYLRGNRELAAALEPLAPNDLPRRRGTLRCLAAPPRRWPSSAAFLGVYAAAALAERAGRGGRARADAA